MMIARCGICESELAVEEPTRLLHHTDGSHEAVVVEHETCRMCEADETGDRMVMRSDDIPLCNGHWNRWVARYLFPSTEEPPCSAHVIQDHTNGSTT